MNEIKFQEEFDRESFEDLLSMTKTMVIEPRRNEPCFCMSGKKYKKCCMIKKGDLDIEFIDSKEFQLAPDMRPEILQYDMNDEDYHTTAAIYELLLVGKIEKHPKAIEDLNNLLKKHPGHPALHTALSLRHLIRRENEALRKTVQKNLKKFPDSRINHLLLKYHEYDLYGSRFFLKIREKLEENPPEDSELSKIYEEKQIPLTEFLLTSSLQIYENLFQEKLHKAILLKDMMTTILEEMR